jgi:hypothetical protein
VKHIAKFSVRDNAFKPYQIQCACGVGGGFSSQDDARFWMQSNHFDKLIGDNTYEFEEKELPVVEAPERPTEHPELVMQPKQVPGPPPEAEKKIPDEIKNETADDA